MLNKLIIVLIISIYFLPDYSYCQEFWARQFERADKYLAGKNIEYGRFLYLDITKSYISKIDRMHENGENISNLYIDWLKYHKRLSEIFDEWFQSFSKGYVFIDLASDFVEPFSDYYLTHHVSDCELESGKIGQDYKGLIELSKKYGNLEIESYYLIKVDEPREGDKYSCEGKFWDSEKVERVRINCKLFIKSYPVSKYRPEVEDIFNIADKYYKKYLESNQ